MALDVINGQLVYKEPDTKVFLHCLKCVHESGKACFYVEDVEENSRTAGDDGEKFLWHAQKFVVTLFDESLMTRPTSSKSAAHITKYPYRVWNRRTKAVNECQEFYVTEIVYIHDVSEFESENHLREHMWSRKDINTEELYILVRYLDELVGDDDEADSGIENSSNRQPLKIPQKLTSSYTPVHTDFDVSIDPLESSINDFERPAGGLARLKYTSEKLIHVKSLESSSSGDEENEDEEFCIIQPISIQLQYEPTLMWVSPYEGKYGLSTTHFQVSERFGNSCEKKLLKVTTKGFLASLTSSFNLSISEAKELSIDRLETSVDEAGFIPDDTIIVDRVAAPVKPMMSSTEVRKSMDRERNAIIVEEEEDSDFEEFEEVELFKSEVHNYPQTLRPNRYHGHEESMDAAIKPEKDSDKFVHLRKEKKVQSPKVVNLSTSSSYPDKSEPSKKEPGNQPTLFELARKTSDIDIDHKNDVSKDQSTRLPTHETEAEIILPRKPRKKISFAEVDSIVMDDVIVQPDDDTDQGEKVVDDSPRMNSSPSTPSGWQRKGDRLPDELSEFECYNCKGIQKRNGFTEVQVIDDEQVADKSFYVSNNRQSEELREDVTCIIPHSTLVNLPVVVQSDDPTLSKQHSELSPDDAVDMNFRESSASSRKDVVEEVDLPAQQKGDSSNLDDAFHHLYSTDYDSGENASEVPVDETRLDNVEFVKDDENELRSDGKVELNNNYINADVQPKENEFLISDNADPDLYIFKDAINKQDSTQTQYEIIELNDEILPESIPCPVSSLSSPKPENSVTIATISVPVSVNVTEKSYDGEIEVSGSNSTPPSVNPVIGGPNYSINEEAINSANVETVESTPDFDVLDALCETSPNTEQMFSSEGTKQPDNDEAEEDLKQFITTFQSDESGYTTSELADEDVQDSSFYKAYPLSPGDTIQDSSLRVGLITLPVVGISHTDELSDNECDASKSDSFRSLIKPINEESIDMENVQSVEDAPPDVDGLLLSLDTSNKDLSTDHPGCSDHSIHTESSESPALEYHHAEYTIDLQELRHLKPATINDSIKYEELDDEQLLEEHRTPQLSAMTQINDFQQVKNVVCLAPSLLPDQVTFVDISHEIDADEVPPMLESSRVRLPDIDETAEYINEEKRHAPAVDIDEAFSRLDSASQNSVDGLNLVSIDSADNSENVYRSSLKNSTNRATQASSNEDVWSEHGEIQCPVNGSGSATISKSDIELASSRDRVNFEVPVEKMGDNDGQITSKTTENQFSENNTVPSENDESARVYVSSGRPLKSSVKNGGYFYNESNIRLNGVRSADLQLDIKDGTSPVEYGISSAIQERVNQSPNYASVTSKMPSFRPSRGDYDVSYSEDEIVYDSDIENDTSASSSLVVDTGTEVPDSTVSNSNKYEVFEVHDKWDIKPSSKKTTKTKSLDVRLSSPRTRDAALKESTTPAKGSVDAGPNISVRDARTRFVYSGSSDDIYGGVDQELNNLKHKSIVKHMSMTLPDKPASISNLRRHDSDIDLKERRRYIAGYGYLSNDIPGEQSIIKGRDYSLVGQFNETEKELNLVRQERRKKKMGQMSISMDWSAKNNDSGHHKVGRVEIPGVFVDTHDGPRKLGSTQSLSRSVGRLSIPDQFSADELSPVQSPSYDSKPRKKYKYGRTSSHDGILDGRRPVAFPENF